MKRIFLLVVALLLATGTAFAAATMQKWTAGWDNFGEPLNYTTSKITWSVNTTTHKLSVTFKLVGATPSKLYQVSIGPRNRKEWLFTRRLTTRYLCVHQPCPRRDSSCRNLPIISYTFDIRARCVSLPRSVLPTPICQRPAFRDAICWGIWRMAAMMRPQVSSAVA